MKIPAVVAVLVVDNIREAIEFYELLGFQEETAYSFAHETGRLVHAHLTKGDAAIFLGVRGVSYFPDHPRAGRIENAGPPHRGLGVTFVVQTGDLDGVYEKVKGKNVEILREPAQEWYGDRVFLFVDPFGYEWKASQPSPGQPAS